MEQALKTCFHFKYLCIENNLRRHWFISLVYVIVSFIFNVGGWGKINCPHNSKVLNIVRLISPMVRSFNVCNVLKINSYDRLNIVRNMHKVVSKLYFENNHKTMVMSVNEINKIRLKKNKIFLFQENNVGGSVNYKNKLMLPCLLWAR